MDDDYYDALKAVTSWIAFWPFLLELEEKLVHKDVTMILNMAVRPIFRSSDQADQMNGDGHQQIGEDVGDNNFLKMVEMLKAIANKHSLEHKKEGQQSSASSILPDTGGSVNAKWTNRVVCMQVSKLVGKLLESRKSDMLAHTATKEKKKHKRINKQQQTLIGELLMRLGALLVQHWAT